MMRIGIISVVTLVATVLLAKRGWCESPKLPQDQFLGEWIAVEVKNRDYTRLKISQEGKNWFVEGWRAYMAEQQLEAAVGKDRLQLLGDGDKDTKLPYGFAEREETFAKTYLTLRIVKDQLVVERYVIFTDGSSRSNYRTVQTLKKK
jgi:hypothetical protein